MMSRLFAPGVAVLAALLLAGCSRPATAPDPVRSVKLVHPQPVASSVHTQEYAADIRPRTESRLGFRVAGKLMQRLVDAGQVVKAGQTLAVLDPQDYQSAATAAQAQVAAALTQRDLAVADLRRFRSLRDQGFVSGAEIERREALLRSAQATVDQAQSQAQVQANQARYTRLLADADGVVAAVEAEPGQVLGAGTPVLRLAHSGPREAVFAVPETRVQGVKPGMPAQVMPWVPSGVEQPVWAAQVREVAASADPQSRTFAVRVTLPEAVQAPLGSTATVRLEPVAGSSSGGNLAVPSTAVWRSPQGSAVWVFDPAAQVVKSRAVQVAGVDGALVLLRAGVGLQDEIVTVGTHVLTEGQRVTRYQPQP